MSTGRTEYMRGYADGAAGRRADPPPEAEAFPPLPRLGALIEVTRSSSWYEQGTRAVLVEYDGSHSWAADFHGQDNRPGSFMVTGQGSAKWWIIAADFKVIG